MKKFDPKQLVSKVPKIKKIKPLYLVPVALVLVLIVGGILIFVATFYTGYWSPFAYFSALAPVVCWYIDDWLGMADRRVAWPTDPVGRLSAAVDRRWPPVDSRHTATMPTGPR